MRCPPPERFHAVARDYARHRPGYPDEIVDRILAAAGLLPPRPEAVVVDLGCGTGISSRAFAARGLRVVGRLFDAHAREGRVPWALRTVGSVFRLG